MNYLFRQMIALMQSVHDSGRLRREFRWLP